METNPNDPINAIKSEQGMYEHDKDYEAWLSGTNPLIGLSKREYFAAMAMQGILAGHYEYFTGNADVSVPSEIAKYAVFNADALIEELNKESKR